MIRNLFLTIFIFLQFLANAQTNKNEVYLLTEKIAYYIETEKFDSLILHLDSNMLRQFDAEKMKGIWESLPNQFGAFESFQKITIDSVPGLLVSQTIVKFKKAKLMMNLVFNKKNEVAGLHFMPKYSYAPPDYINTLSFVEYKIVVGKIPFQVMATLTIPRNVEKPACVIIIGGSGPTDKDMSYGDNKPYKDIAWGLASKGVAVIRYDKRTAAYGPQLSMDEYAGKHLTIKEEYLDDAHDVITYLSKSKLIDPKKIVVAGHSEGGMLAPLIFEQNKNLAGVIMLEANARPMQDLLVEQMNYLYKDVELPFTQRKQIEDAKRHAVYAKDPHLKPNFSNDSLPGATAPYWISVNTVHQVESAKKIKKPMLFIQGERDYQVTLTDFTIWKEALANKTNCTFKLYPKLNHHLMEGEGRANGEEYAKRSNVPEYLIDDMANWIRRLEIK